MKFFSSVVKTKSLCMGAASFASAAVLWGSAATVAVGYSTKSVAPLISAEDLEKEIARKDFSEDMLILDTRSRYKDYIKGHVPMARHLNFGTLRGTDENGVPVQYLPADLTRNLLERAGVSENKRVVVYADSTGDDILSASMVAYVLEKHGVDKVQILNGGLSHFAKTGKVSRKYPKIPAGKMGKVEHTKMGIDVAELVAKNKDKNIVLVDARPSTEYLGKDDIWPRQGHIPGAVNIPWQTVVTENNTHLFRPWNQVKKTFFDAGVKPDQEVVVYCGTSREGSLLRFYLTHIAGYKNVRLYEGSWKEYSSISKLPVELKANARAEGRVL